MSFVKLTKYKPNWYRRKSYSHSTQNQNIYIYIYTHALWSPPNCKMPMDPPITNLRLSKNLCSSIRFLFCFKSPNPNSSLSSHLILCFVVVIYTIIGVTLARPVSALLQGERQVLLGFGIYIEVLLAMTLIRVTSLVVVQVVFLGRIFWRNISRVCLFKPNMCMHNIIADNFKTL